MTPGTMLFYSGIGMLVLAFLLSIVFGLKNKKEKHEVDVVMKEMY